MNVRPRGSVWWFVGAGGLFTALLAAFLVDMGEEREPELVVADVDGAWRGADGGRLTVRADGSAELERVTEPRQDCGQSAGLAPDTYTGPATWVFDTYPDEAPGIRFDFPAPDTGKSCKIYLVVVHYKDGTKGGFLPHVQGQYLRSTELTG
ncbi:hypothetical protein ACFV0H_12720 [Streptomyces erythrochromogenes]|uniref:Uncharacterized protein n=1 Tax=Streptomyces erythrochromogenes TaxID=285574 RepID=A0ABZ1QFD6_9ACTN|nr:MULTISPECIES: hypothetical protein [Streptomyces]KOU73909.1 hypothetical protein ADK61_21935 [Streptomyces sp. XY66]MCX5586680.1 hypothetical protein [Streptomyces erythrochromogenes]